MSNLFSNCNTTTIQCCIAFTALYMHCQHLLTSLDARLQCSTCHPPPPPPPPPPPTPPHPPPIPPLDYFSTLAPQYLWSHAPYFITLFNICSPRVSFVYEEVSRIIRYLEYVSFDLYFLRECVCVCVCVCVSRQMLCADTSLVLVMIII